jgi:glyoxylase I family protein
MSAIGKGSTAMSEQLIVHMHHSSFLVADMQQALAFYRDVLGLELDTTRPEMTFAGAWLRVSDTQQIHLLALPNPDTETQCPEHGGRDRHTAFWVTDLSRLVVRLEAADIAYTQSQSGRAAIFCRDPDGNALEFFEK